MVTIDGSDLSPESAATDSSSPFSGKVRVFLGGPLGGECVYNHYASSSTRIVCESPSAADPLELGRSWHHDWYSGCSLEDTSVWVFVDGQLAVDSSGATFEMDWRSTTQIHDVFPRAASPGDRVNISGHLCFSDDTDLSLYGGDESAAGDESTRIPGLSRVDTVAFGAFECDLKDDADENFEFVVGGGFLEGITAGQRSYHGCRSGSFSCRLPPDMSTGFHSVNLYSRQGSPGDAGSGHSITSYRVPWSSETTRLGFKGGEQTSLHTGERYMLHTVPGIWNISAVGDRSLRINGIGLKMDTTVTVAEMSNHVIFCEVDAVSADGKELNCSLPWSESRTLNQIASLRADPAVEEHDANGGFISGLAGLLDERWGFVKGSNWKSHPLADKWDGVKSSSARDIIDNLKQIRREPTTRTLLNGAYDTGPYTESFPPNFGDVALRRLSGFFTAPRTGMYRFPVDYDQRVLAVYLNGDIYPRAKLYEPPHTLKMHGHLDLNWKWDWIFLNKNDKVHYAAYAMRDTFTNSLGSGAISGGVDIAHLLKDAPDVDAEHPSSFTQLVRFPQEEKYRFLMELTSGTSHQLKLQGGTTAVTLSSNDSISSIRSKIKDLFAWRSCRASNALNNAAEVSDDQVHLVSRFENGLSHVETLDQSDIYDAWQLGKLDFSTAACGRGSMKVRSQDALSFLNGGYAHAAGVSLEFYPAAIDENASAQYLNFAYRIPPESRAMMIVTFTIRQTVSPKFGRVLPKDDYHVFTKCAIPLNWAELDEILWPVPRCGEIVNLVADPSGDGGNTHATVTADDTWHSASIDLFRYATTSNTAFGPGDVKIVGISFHAPFLPVVGGCADTEQCCGSPKVGSPSARFTQSRTLKGDFWIDEISLSSRPIKTEMTNTPIMNQLEENRAAVPDVEVSFINEQTLTVNVSIRSRCNDADGGVIQVPDILVDETSTRVNGVGNHIPQSLTLSLSGPSVTTMKSVQLAPHDSASSLESKINQLFPGLNVSVSKQVSDQADTCSAIELEINWKKAVAFETVQSPLCPKALENAEYDSCAESWDQIEFSHPSDQDIAVSVLKNGLIDQFPFSHLGGVFHAADNVPHVLLRSADGMLLSCSSLSENGPCETALPSIVTPHALEEDIISSESSPTSPDSSAASTPQSTNWVDEVIGGDGGDVHVDIKLRKILEETVNDVPTAQVDHHHLASGKHVQVGEYTAEEVDAMRAVSPGGHNSTYGDLRVLLGVGSNSPERRKLLSMTEPEAGTSLRWSDKATWGGNDPPSSATTSIVYIPPGVSLIFDESFAKIDFWIVEGEIRFEDSQDISIEAKAIVINHKDAKFLVGDESTPFTSKFDLKLVGTWGSYGLPKFGIKTLAMTDGEMVLHGSQVSPTWSLLHSTAHANSIDIALSGETNWKSGDDIVIATTAQGSQKMRCKIDRTDSCETEERRIQAITYDESNQVTTITLDRPLKYKHLGELLLDPESGKEIQMRAEVINLSRNIRVHGSTESQAFGSHIMVLAGKVIWKYFEHTFAGQKFQMGRYATHIHTIGQPKVTGGSDQQHSIVQGLSIHKSFNRAITAHGCHNVRFYDNVAYNVLGHMYFIEDGVETGNRYERNVGIMAHRSWSLLNTDQTPAIFWITHPSNYFLANRAVASHFHGFWFDVNGGVSGEPLSSFEDNVAHSNGKSGIWATHLDSKQGQARMPVKLLRSSMWGNPFGISFLRGIGHVQVIDSLFASNGVHLDFWWLKGERWWSQDDTNAPLVENNVFFGNSPLGSGRYAIQLPFSGFLTIKSPWFIGYGHKSPVRSCGNACRGVGGGTESRWLEVHKVGQQGPTISWLKNGGHNILYDIDGTLSGKGQPYFVHRRHFGASSDLGYFPPAHCELDSTVTDGILCDASQVSLRTFQMVKVEEFNEMSLFVETEYGSAKTNFFKYDHVPGRIESQALTLVMSKHPAAPIVHDVKFNAPVWKRPDVYSWQTAEAREVMQDEWAVISFTTSTLPDRVLTRKTGSAVNNYVKVSPDQISLDTSWVSFSEVNSHGGEWSYLPGQNASNFGDGGRLQMLISGKSHKPATQIPGQTSTYLGTSSELPFCDASQDSCASSPKMVYPWTRKDCNEQHSNCPASKFSFNCLEDSAGPMRESNIKTLRWCDDYAGEHNSWSPPGPGEDAIIPPGIAVILDSTCSTTGDIRWLDIYGELHVIDGTWISGDPGNFTIQPPTTSPEIQISAETIHVAAETGKLIIGSEMSPILTSKVFVDLHGDISSASRSIGGGFAVPATKFIFVMGELSMHGKDRMVWGRLGEKAYSGEKKITVVRNPDADDVKWSSLIGERIVVTPTGLDPMEKEVHTVTEKSCSDDNSPTCVLSLSEALLFDHRGPSDQIGQVASHGIPAGEVGFLGDSSNIIVRGITGANEFMGASIGVHLKKFDADSNVPECNSGTERVGSLQGSAKLQNVKFLNCGQMGEAGGSGACLHFYGSFNYADSVGNIGAPSYVRGSTFEKLYNSAIYAVGYRNVLGLTVENNFAYDSITLNSVFYLSGSFSKIRNNLISHVRSEESSEGVTGGVGIQWVQGRFPKEFNGNRTYLADNVVAGSFGSGIMTSGFPCSDINNPYVYGQYEGNVIHTIGSLSELKDLSDPEGADIIGAGLLITMTTFNMRGVRAPKKIYGKSKARCGAHHGYIIYSTNNFGISSWGAAQSTWLSDMLLYNTKIGFHAWNAGANSQAHLCSAGDHVLFRRSRVIGEALTCGQIGFIPASFYTFQMPFKVSSFGGNNPSMCGSTILNEVDFENFGLCSDQETRNYAISNGVRNTPSDFTVHMEMYNIRFPSTDESSKLQFVPPPLARVMRDSGNIQGTCAQFDCDGFRNTIIEDRTGSLLVGGSPGTIVSRGSERRWNQPLLYTDPEGRESMASLIPDRARWPMTEQERKVPLTDEELFTNVGMPTSGCTEVSTWDGYSCPNGRHKRLIFENMDADSMRRRLFPLAVNVHTAKGHQGPLEGERFMSMYTGPAAYGVSWELKVKRLSTASVTTLVGSSHDLYTAGSLPTHLRLRLLDASEDDAVHLRIMYGIPNMVNIYVNGKLMPQLSNVTLKTHRAGIVPMQLDASDPSLQSGAGYYNRVTGFLEVIVRGNQAVDLKVSDSVLLTVDTLITEEEFFDSGADGLVKNLAALLDIPEERIAVAGVQKDDGASKRRSLRRLAQNSGSISSVSFVIDPEFEEEAPELAPQEVPLVESDPNLEVDEAVEAEQVPVDDEVVNFERWDSVDNREAQYAQNLQTVTQSLTERLSSPSGQTQLMQGVNADFQGFTAETSPASPVEPEAEAEHSGGTDAENPSSSPSPSSGLVPASWGCDPSQYSDGIVCDCECGAWDPDCERSEAPVSGCDLFDTSDAVSVIDACSSDHVACSFDVDLDNDTGERSLRFSLDDGERISSTCTKKTVALRNGNSHEKGVCLFSLRSSRSSTRHRLSGAAIAGISVALVIAAALVGFVFHKKFAPQSATRLFTWDTLTSVVTDQKGADEREDFSALHGNVVNRSKSSLADLAVSLSSKTFPRLTQRLSSKKVPTYEEVL